VYDHVIEEHVAFYNGIATNRRVFDFQLKRGLYTARGEGVFLYRQSGQFRIDLYIGTAELIFQYFRSGGRSLVFFPREGRAIEGENGLIVLDGIEGLEGMSLWEEELSAAMLCLYDLAGDIEDLLGVREGKDGYLLCFSGGEEIRFLQLDPETYTLIGYTAMVAGRKLREIRFSSFTEISGMVRPGSVTYKDHEKGLEIELSVRTERINDTIDTNLFSPLF
jgi:hypothetical protein